MIYNYPQYCEILFDTRDIPSETAFLRKCIDRYSNVPVRRALEICCGNAPHAGELAGSGLTYIGLDRNHRMLQYCRDRWSLLDPKAEFIEADMLDFTLEQPADFVFVMIGSLYFSSIDDVARHFDSVSQSLNPGGLYLLDSCIQFNNPLEACTGCTVQNERDGISVQSSFDIKLLDSARQYYEEHWTTNVNDHGRNRSFTTIECNKAIYPQEFLLFITARPDFEFVGWWRDWDLTKPIDHTNSVPRPIAIVRRT